MTDNTTLAGDITVAVCLLIMFIAAAGLGYYVFGAVRELVLSWA
jgi:hypothetical protein